MREFGSLTFFTTGDISIWKAGFGNLVLNLLKGSLGYYQQTEDVTKGIWANLDYSDKTLY